MADINDDTFDSLPVSAVEAKVKLAEMYYERFHEQMVTNTQQSSAKTVVEKKKRMDTIDNVFNKLISVLHERLKLLIIEKAGSAAANSTTNASTNQQH